MIAAVLFFAEHFAEPIKVLAWAVFNRRLSATGISSTVFKAGRLAAQV